MTGMSEQDHAALLPSGLSDLLAPDAQSEAQAITTVMDVFARFGYDRVKPPLMEFEDHLLSPGPGAALARQTFRLMDPLSQRMMGLRADTTAQIARIADSRLAGEERPLRLSYAADVLRVNGTQIRPARQFVQVGCEMIGAHTPQGDAEIALIALAALKEIGIENMTIDLTVPMLISHIFEHYSVPKEQREEMETALSQKDKNALGGISSQATDLLSALLEVCGPEESAFEKLKSFSLDGQILKDIETLQEMCADLKDGMAAYEIEAQITVDLVEHRGLEYETGISFTLYSKDVRGELGGGGRYSLSEKAQDQSATGFTLYMDSLLPALPKQDAPKTKILPASAGWKEIRAAQDDGLCVKRKI